MKRIIWIDYAKVIGLFLVILAHLYTSEGIGSANVVRSFIYGFHMPFFFLISGCLYKVRDGGLRQALIVNVKKLLLPYICLNLFFAIVYGIISSNPIHQLRSLPYGIVLGKGTPCGASWFVIALFFIKCSYDFLSYNKIENIIIPLVFVLTLFLNRLSFSHNYFYFKSVLIGICFFHLGRICLGIINRVKMVPVICIIASITLFIISYYITRLNGIVSLYVGTMGNNSLLFYANAIIGSLGIISISHFTSIPNKTICEMSNASIAVVLLHMIFVEGARNGVKHFDISGIALFIVYALISVIIYYLCYTIFMITNKRFPFIWGKF